MVVKIGHRQYRLLLPHYFLPALIDADDSVDRLLHPLLQLVGGIDQFLGVDLQKLIKLLDSLFFQHELLIKLDYLFAPELQPLLFVNQLLNLEVVELVVPMVREMRIAQLYAHFQDTMLVYVQVQHLMFLFGTFYEQCLELSQFICSHQNIYLFENYIIFIGTLTNTV